MTQEQGSEERGEIKSLPLPVDFLNIPRAREQVMMVLDTSEGLGGIGRFHILFPEQRATMGILEEPDQHFSEVLQEMYQTFFKNVESINRWKPGTIDPEEARVYADACLRANVIATSGADDWHMGAAALEHYLFTKGIKVPGGEYRNQGVDIHTILTETNSAARRAILRQDPRWDVMTCLTLIGQNAVASKEGRNTNPEKRAYMEEIILDIAASESPPTVTQYDTYQYYFRSQFARSLVLLRDIAASNVCPHTMGFVDRAVGQLTHAPNYATRAHLLPYQILEDNPLRANLTAAQETIAKVKPGMWSDSAHAFGIEASVKGTWGAAEAFFLQSDVAHKINELADQLGLTSCNTEWGKSLYRRTRTLATSSIFEQLITRHHTDPRVAALKDKLLAHVASLQDHVRLRLNVGSVGWDGLHPAIEHNSDARILLAAPKIDGSTHSHILTREEALHVLQVEGDDTSLPEEIRKELMEGFSGVRELRDFIAKFEVRGRGSDNLDERDVLAAWILGAREPGDETTFPFATILMTDRLPNDTPFEIQVAPFDHRGVRVAMANWEARVPFKFICPPDAP